MIAKLFGKNGVKTASARGGLKIGDRVQTSGLEGGIIRGFCRDGTVLVSFSTAGGCRPIYPSLLKKEMNR